MEKKKILLVEDNKTIAKFVKLALTQEGYSVCAVAGSGEKAIELANSTHPDLILMNIKLEGRIDGVEACEEIKKINDIPVIFVSAYTDSEIITKAKRCDPRDYVVKPFKVRGLLKRVAKEINKQCA